MSEDKKTPTELNNSALDAASGGGGVLDHDFALNEGSRTMKPHERVAGAGVSPFRTADLREASNAEIEDRTRRIGANPTPHP